MREIKFRGRTFEDGWVYGTPVFYRDGKVGMVVVEPFRVSVVAVIPETVGQFIGLHYKNGVEIYEGDVLGFPNDNPLVVTWVECDCAFKGIDTKLDWHFGILPQIRYPGQAKVIGNIHENPELVEANHDHC